jgi:hypothetical protein
MATQGDLEADGSGRSAEGIVSLGGSADIGERMGPATAKAVEATAKAADKALTIVHDTGGYLREVVGDLPKNAVGILGADWLGQKRIRNLDAMMRRTEAILRERDAQPVDQLSPNLATELLSSAQEESREELIELWARLLANALDPNMNTLRHSFIEAVKKMDPPDARVVSHIYLHRMSSIQPGDTSSSNTALGQIARDLQTRSADVEVSTSNLEHLGFLRQLPSGNWVVTAVFREFMRACYPEHAHDRA